MLPLNEIIEQLQSETDLVALQRLARDGLEQVAPDEDPELWARLQGSLAATTARIADGRYSPEVLRAVLDGYQAALTVFSADRHPVECAHTLRNIGATHIEAAHSGLPDGEAHVDAAIAAFDQALAIPAGHEPDIDRLGILCDLAGALAMAAYWLGAEALLRSAAAYDEALGYVSKEADPHHWGWLKLQAATQLANAAADQFEPALKTAEEAVRALDSPSARTDWAEAQLLIGSLYRERRGGDRADDLDRATAALDAALSVFTEQANSQQWAMAHYQRGPAYLFRERGDKEQNLREAEASFRIAIGCMPQRDSTWAALQVSLAQSLLDRKQGDFQHHVESVIPVLESALEVLESDAGSPVWRLALRYLGQAYLGRHARDRAENVERALRALQTVQQGPVSPDDDIREWATAQNNLGYAYVRRVLGEAARNRADAIAALEAVSGLPLDREAVGAAWGIAQSWLAILDMDPQGVDFAHHQKAPPSPPRRDQDDSQPAPRADDPFELASQAREQLQAFATWRDGTALPRGREPGWHVPFHLNDHAVNLFRHFDEFLESGTVPSRSSDERAALEQARWTEHLTMLEHMAEKYSSARRVGALFDAVARGQRPFVLFLRGFNQRATHLHGMTLMQGTGNLETFEKTRLVEKLPSVALVWIANPVDSPLMDMAVTGKPEEAFGYRLEAGEGWERDVRTLISSAAFIVMDNPEMTPGVLAEVHLVHELGRLEDTLFRSASNANQALGRTDCRELSDEALARIDAEAPARAQPVPQMPEPTCAWVSGKHRRRMEGSVLGLERWIARMNATIGPAPCDLTLDACSYRLGLSLLLERLDWLPTVLDMQAQCYESLQGSFPAGPTLAQTCRQEARTWRSVWDRTSATEEPLSRTAEALRMLAEDPEGKEPGGRARRRG